MKEAKEKKLDLIVICHNIRSRHNVGSIFRTADGAGVSRIFLCGITPAPPHQAIEKVSLGAENYLLWEKARDAWRVIETLKKEGYEIVALEQAENSIDYRKYYQTDNRCRFGGKMALVLGNEVEGLPESVLKRVDKIIFIPMRGKKESLNVSVAFGVAVYGLLDFEVE